MNIYDISKQCGVSIATVSRVLNNSNKVSERTRLKVLSVINKTGFIPRAARNSSKVIAIVCTSLESGNNAHVIQMISSKLQLTGFEIRLFCSSEEAVDKKHILEACTTGNYFAVIICGTLFFEYSTDIKVYLSAFKFACPVIILGSLADIDNFYCCEYNLDAAVTDYLNSEFRSGKKEPLLVYDKLNRHSKQMIDIFSENCSLNNVDITKKNICLLSDKPLAFDDEANFDLIVISCISCKSAIISGLKERFPSASVICVSTSQDVAENFPTLYCSGDEYAGFAINTISSLKNGFKAPDKMTYPIIRKNM